MKKEPIYVIGIQEHGGCLLLKGEYYTDKKEADRNIGEFQKKGMNYVKRFTLYPVED